MTTRIFPVQLKKMFKNRIAIVIVCLLVAYPAAKLPGKFTITVTKSVNPRIFWTNLYNNDSSIEQDQYVRAEVYKDLPGMDCKPCLLVKRVGCAPGSHLKTVGKSYYCNDELIGKAHREDYVKFSQTLGEDDVFLIGDIAKSYDSRYFGLVKKERINAKLTPIY
jgi:conjugal transfer pilin signal peptidase TrbI